mmetsp:Transcript_31870/g.34239  ORF Transcript_31870/g.34239 Transcript_31870/m.34239 type:complete len:93 (+) Transcript_31870:304-582(+)
MEYCRDMSTIHSVSQFETLVSSIMGTPPLLLKRDVVPKWVTKKNAENMDKVKVKDKINTKERSIGGHRESAFAILPASPSIDDNDDRGQQQQ